PSNNVEIDIVGADRESVATQLLFLGSIKWLENATFDDRDLAALHRHRAALTDEPVPLVALSRNGVGCSGLDASCGPEELLAAWRPTPTAQARQRMSGAVRAAQWPLPAAVSAPGWTAATNPTGLGPAPGG